MSDLTAPVLIFGSMIALLVGAFVHLIGGGKLIQLIFCLVFSWIGFWTGNHLANRFSISFLKYGQVNYGLSIIVAIIMALFGYWISGDNSFKSE